MEISFEFIIFEIIEFKEYKYKFIQIDRHCINIYTESSYIKGQKFWNSHVKDNEIKQYELITQSNNHKFTSLK